MTEPILERRARLMGPNVQTFYEEPVHLVRGEGVWLWDRDGKRYLDCYNNVPHVGHAHPKVVEAIARQAATLNTHTRYLHETILDYIDNLTGTFDHGLSQMIMTCTGSEANDIALRMAQAVTGEIGIIATDNTYHGNTAAVSQLSTRRPPIGGYAPHVRLVPAPDSLKPLGGTRAGQAKAFAQSISVAVEDLRRAGFGFSGMMLCPVFANEGLPDLPQGFLAPAAQVIRDAGGLLLCDEVQPGFGRLGETFWGHDLHAIAPDVVTLGKPMANGHPCAGVVATPKVMSAFREAFGYFNTFGGNPVSCAAALATLEVVKEEGLQENARDVGAYLLDGFSGLSHSAIAEVRGQGLFFGIELQTHEGAPASNYAERVVEEMRRRGVLMNRIGRARNTLKIRPPLPFGRAHADILLETLTDVLNEVPHD